MKVVLSDLARARLHEIQGYIAFDNARAAVRVVDRILWSAELLGEHPKLGPKWRKGPTRAFNVPGYSIGFTTGSTKRPVWSR
jgi:plasmid stabilization system protein ParE